MLNINAYIRNEFVSHFFNVFWNSSQAIDSFTFLNCSNNNYLNFKNIIFSIHLCFDFYIDKDVLLASFIPNNCSRIVLLTSNNYSEKHFCYRKHISNSFKTSPLLLTVTYVLSILLLPCPQKEQMFQSQIVPIVSKTMLMRSLTPTRL